MPFTEILDRFTVHQVLETGHAFENQALRSRPDAFRYAVPRTDRLVDVYFMVVQNTAIVPVLARAVQEENKGRRDNDYLIAVMVEGGRNVALWSGESFEEYDAASFLEKLVFKRTYY
jgi:hypothetical protein